MVSDCSALFLYVSSCMSCLYCHVYIQMEAKVILALLLRNFDLTLPKDYKLKRIHAITSKPMEGIPCTLEIRTRDS